MQMPAPITTQPAASSTGQGGDDEQRYMLKTKNGEIQLSEVEMLRETHLQT